MDALVLEVLILPSLGRAKVLYHYLKLLLFESSRGTYLSLKSKWMSHWCGTGHKARVIVLVGDIGMISPSTIVRVGVRVTLRVVYLVWDGHNSQLTLYINVSKDSTDLATRSHDSCGSYMSDAQVVNFLSESIDFYIHMIEATNFICPSYKLHFLYGSAFTPQLVVVLTHVFDEIIGLIEGFIHESPSCSGINGYSCVVK